MNTYSVNGPFKIPVEIKPAGRIISDKSDFWKTRKSFKDKSGVYVFGMQAGGGINPFYVGMSTGKNKFEKECFQPHKLNKYNEALSEYKRGLPVMFFITKEGGRGPINKKEVKMIEDFLISVGMVRNEGLLNIKGTKRENWAISGVIRGSKGKPSKSANKFKSMMGMKK